MSLVPIIAEILHGRPGFQAQVGDKFTWERVDAVRGDGKVVVRSAVLPVTGKATVQTGQRVCVAWKNGVPVAVVAHRWRRAQFHGKTREEGAGIVEQLVVGNFDNTQANVWYRNYKQLTKVDVVPYLQGQTPQSVKWGLDGTSFAVQASGGVYGVFAFDRDDPNVADPEFPANSQVSLVWCGTPLQTNIPLCTVSWTNSNATTLRYQTVKVSEDYYAWTPYKTKLWTYTGGGYNPDCWIWIPPTDVRSDKLEVTHDWEASGDASASASASSEESFGLLDALRGKDDGQGGTFSGSVVDWFLDGERRLKFLFLASWGYYRSGPIHQATGTGSIPFGTGKDLKEPTVFSSLGNPPALPGDSQSLTVPGIHESLLGREPLKAHAVPKRLPWTTARA